MTSVLGQVKHYQQTIEKYPEDEQKVLKCVDKLSNLAVTVQHLQETGVGRTVNALRKETGDVGQAARALVSKWKLMVSAEDSDLEDHNNEVSNYNGSGEESDDHESRSRSQPYANDSITTKFNTSERGHQHLNGNHSGTKRKYSSENDEPTLKNVKKSRMSDEIEASFNSNTKVNSETSEQDTENSNSAESESDMTGSSEQETVTVAKIKKEPSNKNKSSNKHRSNHHKSDLTDHTHHTSDHKLSHVKTEKSPHGHSDTPKKYSEHDKTHSSKSRSHSSNKHEKSKDKHSENKHSRQKSSDKEKSHKHDSNRNKNDSDKPKSSSHKVKISDGSDEHKNHSERHSSDKHVSSSRSDKSLKDKDKTSSDKEGSNSKNKSKSYHHSSSKENKEKLTSSDKEKNKSHKSKSHDSHKSDKKEKSKSEHRSKTSDKEGKEKDSERHSKHKSSSSASKSKKNDGTPKIKQVNSGDSDDGIDCGSGASFAEALGMISPAKPKKKTTPLKASISPVDQDLSPASLLSPSAKLAPLPALEISALPEISPNYKPKPPPKFLPHFTDEEAMSAVISSKNQRTKVYSGNKVLGKLPTLFEMCVQVLQQHIDALEYTGGVPYEILKPVVDKATPQQLVLLEHFNPYLMEDTDHLWQKFCEKSFRNKQRQELESWREMYMRCQEEQESKLKSLTNNIRIAQEAKRAPIKQTKMAYVDSVVKPPRNIARKQAVHGTAHAASASPAARVAALATSANVRPGGSTRPVASVAPTNFIKPKKAPLMQKALQFMRGRKR